MLSRNLRKMRKAWRRYKISNIEVAYLCDRKACDGCSTMPNPDCSHTLDIRHAVNIENIDDNHYIEIADISHLITK